MDLICRKCNEMPLIKFSFIKEGKIIVIINCKCGRTFHDISTFIAEYTNILKLNKNKNSINSKNKPQSDKNLIYWCETCFQNIYNELNQKHKGHILIKIDKNFPIITEKEFEKITEKLKLAENKIKKYLIEMKDMLLNDCKNESERKEIDFLSETNMYLNDILLKFLKLVYNLYLINKKNNTLTYQIIQNLKLNCDYNLNKYNLDLKNISKERFFSFLKSCMILCCNSFINRIYENFVKDKEELKKLIFSLKPLNELNKDEIPIFIDEIIKSNSSIYYGEKSRINNLANGRGFLFCASGSHYFGYFKDDFFQTGFGKTINKNGNTYLGQFKEGLANGIGKFITKNGNIYKGYWKDNKLNGYGNICWDNGKSYNGEINKGIFNGIGELYYKNGNIYRGELKNGRMDGTGMILYKNKKVYKGQFKEGSKNGFGLMTWPTQEKYEGSWENDSFKFGEYFWPNGNIYFGNFQNDYVNGFGTFYNRALSTIETGLWKDGKRVDINDKDTIPATRYLCFL